MGIHGNATAQINIDGAIGTLVGQPHKGLAAMFVMMNEARLGVAVQGLAQSEVAYQNAVAYARERLQGRSLTGPKNANGPADSIIVHPDVRRMLMSMKSRVEAMRALAYVVAAMFDQAHRAGDEAARSAAHAGVDLLIPILKGWCTETGIEVASTGIQVHGGIGFTWEHPAHLYFKRAKSSELLFGDPTYHRELLAQRIGL